VIEHTFIFDWRHVAAPLGLTALVGVVVFLIAFWE
jgi:hypothetical protein